MPSERPTRSLAPAVVETVLARLGLTERPSLDLEGLGVVYGAWCRAVPFDNLLKRCLLKGVGPSPQGPGAEGFFRDWLSYGTGGTCWAASGALASLLRTLGFAATVGIGKMGGSEAPEPNHGTVVVRLEGRAVLVDASILHEVPLVLGADAVIAGEHPARRCRLAHADALPTVFWHPLHMPAEMPCALIETEAGVEQVAHLGERSMVFSLFNFGVYARRNEPAAITGTCFGWIVEVDGDGARAVRRIDEAARARFLVERLGYAEELVQRLPPDDPLPPPLAQRLAGAFPG